MMRLTAFLAALLGAASQPDSCPPGTTWDSVNCIPDESAACNGYTYNGRCVSSCPDGTTSWGSKCVDSCPSDMYVYMGNCVSVCPSSTYINGERCVETCPVLNVGDKCVDNCPSHAPIMYHTSCFDRCPSPTKFTTDFYGRPVCVDSCPAGTFGYQGECMSGCPSTDPYLYKGDCVKDCKSLGLYYEETEPNKCVDICPNKYQTSNNMCVGQCFPGQLTTGPLGKDCREKCPMNIPWIVDGTYCDTSCPNFYDVATLTCVNSCPSGTTLNGLRCEPPTPTCDSSQYLADDGTCQTIQPCNFYVEGRCVASCPADYLEQWGQCVRECSPAAFRDGNKCVSYCETGRAYNGTCVANCPREAPLNANGKCVAQCPALFKSNGMGDCNCAGVWDIMGECQAACPTSMLTVDGVYCAMSCPSTHRQEGKNCTWINPCTSNQYMNSNGTCVNYPTPVCGADQWYWNSTCITACKEGEALTLEGKCMNLSSMCEKTLPGSYMNNQTQMCECPEGQWITRDAAAAAADFLPVRCAPATSSDRINCRSFVDNTVYDPVLDNCVCDERNPVVVPVTDKTWFPYACAPAGTATTTKQCVAPEYFDFMEGGCVKSDSDYTPRPSVSARPSMDSKPSVSVRPSVVPLPTMTASPSLTHTALPSRYPSKSVSVTRTPRPSNIPGSPSPSTTPSRSVKPSALIFADVTRKPLPSIQTVRPPPAEVRKSPAPSPWPKKVTVDIPPEEKPAYIDARMTIPGGNASEVAKPERIQQIQASLACTLRMPLENLRIKNITTTDAAGRKTRVDVDPEAFMMVGDGSADCYDFRNLTRSGRRMLRALGATGGGSVEVDYTIVEPSDAILTMDTAQFNEVITKSPVLVEAAAAIGGSAPLAVAVDALQAFSIVPPSASPSPSPGSGSSSSSSGVDLRITVGAAIAGIALVVGGAFLVVFYRKEAVRAKRMLQEEQARKAAAPRVVLMYGAEEKHHMMNPLGRVDYGAETTRSSAAPMKATHGPIFGSAV
jgi:hypothetical protein